jgi:hypothetical protein
MEIILNTRQHGYYLEVIAENVNISEDVESRTYPKDENGRFIYRNPERDIDTVYLEQVVRLCNDMIYHRRADFDSSDLIINLFEKLPDTILSELLKKLNSDYE